VRFYAYEGLNLLNVKILLFCGIAEVCSNCIYCLVMCQNSMHFFDIKVEQFCWLT